jgi:hypothetical protein
MTTYQITYRPRHSHPDGGTYLGDTRYRDLIASDAQTARDAIRGLNPGCHLIACRVLESA